MPQKKVGKPGLQINGTIIANVNNFLGITINNHLHWDSHINKVAKKVYKITGILNKLKQLTHSTSHKLWYIGMGLSSSTNSSNHEFKLLKGSDIYKLQKLKFYHILMNKQLPEYFNNMPYTQTSEIHQYDT